MSRDLFHTVLQQLKGLSKLIHLHVLGEPLLHKDVGIFIDMCGESGFEVNLVTNGAKLGDRGVDLLGLPALRQVSVSMQAFAGETGAFDAYLAGIAAFSAEALERGGPNLCLRLWDLGDGETPDDRAWLLSRVEAAFGLKYPLVAAARDKATLQIAGNVKIHFDRRFEWPDMNAKEIGDRGFCRGLRNQIAVLADGTVAPCCLDRDGVVALGRVGERTIREILDTPRARAIVEGFSRGIVVEPLCRKCTYRLRFGAAGRRAFKTQY